MKTLLSRHSRQWLAGAFWACAFSAAAAPAPLSAPLSATVSDTASTAAPASLVVAEPPTPLAAANAAPTDSARPSKHRPWRTDYTVAPGVTWHYERPGQLRWLLHIPRDLGQYPKYAFKRDNIPTIAAILVGSAGLFAFDEEIISGSQNLGRWMGLKATSEDKTLVHIPFSVGSVNIPFEFNVPDNLNSTFYFLGDGWTHLTIASSFLAYGVIKKDNRASQTATQLGEAILSTGLVVQAMKRTSGRQSPFRSTNSRGRWDFLPSYHTYQSSVSNFDAFPTGHLATAMATVTVIAENYPEYHFIRPVGYGLMTLLGYSMLNNGVHWASDYPVGIALGYGFAKIAVRNGRTQVAEPGLPPTGPGTGWVAPPHPKPWYRQPKLSPYSLGPFQGMSVSWQPK